MDMVLVGESVTDGTPFVLMLLCTFLVTREAFARCVFTEYNTLYFFQSIRHSHTRAISRDLPLSESQSPTDLLAHLTHSY